MPSEAFIKAASAVNRQPVVCLAIESPDAIEVTVSSQSEWETCALTDINTTELAGQVRLATDDVDSTSGISQPGPVVVAEIMLPPATLGTTTTIESVVFGARQRLTGITVSYERYSYILTDSTTLYGRRNSGSWEVVATNPDSNVPGISTLVNMALTRGTWEFKLSVTVEALYEGFIDSICIHTYQEFHETHYLPTGSLTTPAAALDLGVVPTVSSRFEVEDVKSPGSDIIYNAYGRNSTGDSWTDLFEVHDGDTLAPYRYYQITAALTSSSDGMNTPTIDEIRIIGGDSQYTYISTHKDIPIVGAYPYIMPGGISSISSKIDLLQQATVGELTAKLYWRKKLGDMIAGDYLKNKTIICKLGFVGLAESDYEPYFVGTWYDYQSDPEKGIVTVKTRNILKRFSKKIPTAESFLVKERFHIAFGTDSSGTGLSHNPAGMSHVGFYLDFTDTDSTDAADYAWSTLNSSTGISVGADKNAAARYLHIAFATNATGTTGFDSTTTTGKTFVGSYIDNTAADSSAPTAYNWVLMDAATNLLNVIYSKPATPIEADYSGNIMRVMLNIIDALGIPGRLINETSFTSLETGARSGTDWAVARTLTEPQDAMEMLNELSVSSGVFLFEGADGRWTAKLYDDFAVDAPAATLDAAHYKFRPADGGQKDLYTRQAIYYNLQSGDGGSTNDYADCLLKINAASEVAWDETNTREWKDKWGISPAAIQLLAARWDSWFSVPRAPVRVEDIPPRLMSLDRGDVVAVNNLRLPCPAEYWPGYTVATRFLVMGKGISDPTTVNLAVSLDLLQLEDAVFSTTSSFPAYDITEYVPPAPEVLPVWTQRTSAGSRLWRSIASSDDGTKIVAAVTNGYLYTSTDSGDTWTQRDSARNWLSVTSSADGIKLAACVSGGYIYTSTDSGETWTQRESSRSWYGIASSSDGTKLVAAGPNSYIYTSTDSGVTWTQRGSYGNWTAVASSADGTKLVAVAQNGYPHTSTDSGITWIQRTPAHSWKNVASSADGTKLIAYAISSYLYKSTNSGANWNPSFAIHSWSGIASSADGTKLVACVNNGYIYTSTDSGAAWAQGDSSRSWSDVASSADGTKLVACVNDGYIYTSP